MSVPEIWYKAYAYLDGATYHGVDARLLHYENPEPGVVASGDGWAIKRHTRPVFGSARSKKETLELLKVGLLVKWTTNPKVCSISILPTIIDMQRYLDDVEDNLNDADDSGGAL